MKTLLQLQGTAAERAVADYLMQQGYALVAHNYTIKAGEIDLIVKKGEVVAFVEVKMRTTYYFNLSLVVDKRKQHKIIATALHYATKNRLNQHVLRFDVALVEAVDELFTIQYIPNAFTAGERL